MRSGDLLYGIANMIMEYSLCTLGFLCTTTFLDLVYFPTIVSMIDLKKVGFIYRNGLLNHAIL